MKEQERQVERIEHLSAEGEEQGRVLIDLSTAGAAFLHPQEIRAESRIVLLIRDLAIDAVVVYCHKRADDGYRVGTRFRNNSPALQAGLAALVEDFSRGAMVSYKIDREIVQGK
jgi:hypothetical protein